MTKCSKILTTSGLFLALAGCILLARFGLPPDFDPTGAQHLLVEGTDQAAIAKGNRYRLLGRIGILLIGVGSI
jgi:hypothetical protein